MLQAEPWGEAAFYGAVFSKRGTRNRPWREREAKIGAKFIAQLSLRAILLFLRRSPSVSVCVGVKMAIETRNPIPRGEFLYWGLGMGEIYSPRRD